MTEQTELLESVIPVVKKNGSLRLMNSLIMSIYALPVSMKWKGSDHHILDYSI